jgi:hypothetical protein
MKYSTFKTIRTHFSSDPSCAWQGFCIVLMLAAGTIFGLIIGQLQETFSVANQRAREMEDHIDSIFTFLQENKLGSLSLRSECFAHLAFVVES